MEKKEFKKFKNKNFSNKKGANVNKPKKAFEDNNQEKEYEDIIEGRNSVIELLESSKDVNKIYIQNGERHRIY